MRSTTEIFWAGVGRLIQDCNKGKRQDNRLTYRRISAHIGKSESDISRYRNGHIGTKPEIEKQIADYFGKSIFDILAIGMLEFGEVISTGEDHADIITRFKNRKLARDINTDLVKLEIVQGDVGLLDIYDHIRLKLSRAGVKPEKALDHSISDMINAEQDGTSG